MIKLYRDLTIILHVGEVVLFALYLVLALVMDLPLWTCAVGLFVMLLAWQFLVARIATRRLNGVLELLNNCHVQEAARKYEALLTRARRTTVPHLKLNLSACYLEAGESRRAIETLESMPPMPEKKPWALTQLCRNLNLAGGLRMLDRLDEADTALSRAEACMADVSDKALERNGLRSACAVQTMLQKMTRGDFDGAIPFFTAQLETAGNLRKTVASHYDLAWALSHEGRQEEAREHLQYVAENGGDTWYVSAAKKRLELM